MIKNMSRWIQEILISDERRAIPLMAAPGLELLNLHITDVLRDGAGQASCIRLLASRYPSAACVTFMDLSVEAEAFGSEISFFDNETPSVTGKIVTGLDSARALVVPAVGDARMRISLEAAAISSGEISDRPVFGCHIGPFSLAGRLCGMTETLMNVYTEPETLHLVLEKCADFLVNYACAFREAGVNGVVIAEPAAGLISPALCEEFSSRYVRRIIDEVQNEYFMVILHNCGATRHHAPVMVSTGAMGLHFGNVVNMRNVITKIPSDVIVLGNLDPAGLLKGGSPEEVGAATEDLLRNMAAYGNFVLSSGCDIPQGTPLENIDKMFAALAEYITYVHGGAGKYK